MQPLSRVGFHLTTDPFVLVNSETEFYIFITDDWVATFSLWRHGSTVTVNELGKLLLRCIRAPLRALAGALAFSIRFMKPLHLLPKILHPNHVGHSHFCYILFYFKAMESCTVVSDQSRAGLLSWLPVHLVMIWVHGQLANTTQNFKCPRFLPL